MVSKKIDELNEKKYLLNAGEALPLTGRESYKQTIYTARAKNGHLNMLYIAF